MTLVAAISDPDVMDQGSRMRSHNAELARFRASSQT